jgi:hypothetical protein
VNLPAKAVSGGGNGVIHMGLLNIIRRMYLRQKLSIREIARLTGVSRNTVTKHLAANTIEPNFATPERQSKIDPFAEKLAGWLKTEAGKSRKQRRTVKQLHADLAALGFTGSYDRVAAFARRWRADRQREQQTTGRGTFVPLHFDPGDAFQFDWSEDFAVLGGERTKLQMAHMKLSHSRAFLLRIYPDRLVVAAEGNILCEHARVIQRSHHLPPKTIYDWRHYLAVVQRKPGALRNGAPFLELPTAFKQLQDHMLRKPGGDREMVDILALVLHHDEQAVLTAVELSLAEGVPTKTHVLNRLHRLVDGKVIGGPPLDTPQALALHREPKANVERYDGLRAQIAGGRHAS